MDLADGLSLAGSNEALNDPGVELRLAPSIVWAREANVYGLVLLTGAPGDSSERFGILFETFDQAGKTHVSSRPASFASESARHTAIAWGGDRFGIAFGGYQNLSMAPVGANGVVQTRFPVASPTSGFTSLAIARVGTGNWGLVYTVCGMGGCGVSADALSATGKVGDTFGLSQTASGSVVAIADRFAMTYDVGGVAKLELREQALAPASSALSLTGATPVLGAGPSSFAVATHRAGLKPVLNSFTNAGAAECSNVEIGTAGLGAASVAGAQDGFLVAFYGGSVQHVSTECVAGPLVSLGGVPADVAVRAAAGTDGYALVWVDETARVSRRRFGTRLCN